MSEDIFQYIDIERTIAENGHDPRELSKGSEKKVFVICPNCHQQRTIMFFSALVSTVCRKCSYIQIHYSHNKLTDEDLINVDVQETISKFLYNPKSLSTSSNKKVVAICTLCKEKRVGKLCNILKVKICRACSAKETGKKLKGREINEKQKAALNKTGKPMSEETKKKLSLLNKGKQAALNIPISGNQCLNLLKTSCYNAT